jgi:PhoH-like ATPase
MSMPLPKRAELFYGLKLTDEQKKYVDSIFDKRLTIVDSCAGSGKTTLAVASALIMHEEAKKTGNPNGKPLVYIFSPTQEKILGYRPGTQSEKEEEYLQPLKDALLAINEYPARVIYNEEALASRQQSVDNVWVYPKSHVFARGTNIKDCTVILDEFQNYTLSDAKKILTRIADSCTTIIIGHHLQIDLHDKKQSGFVPYKEYFRNKHYCNVLELTKNFRGELSTDADNFNWQ